MLPQIIDTDVHPSIGSKLGDIFPYVDQKWRQIMADRAEYRMITPFAGRQPRFNDNLQLDATTPSGGRPGSDPTWMAEHYLDPHNVGVALLSVLEGARVDSWTQMDEAAVVASAFNRMVADEWLATDGRFRMAMIVSPHDPLLAAEEVRRFGPTPGVVAVWIPLINRLVGTRYFYPIYEAAQELGLQIFLHPTGSTGDIVDAAVYAGGNPGSRFEHYTLLPEFAISSLASLLAEGVFERFPTLNWFICEWGWAWLPAFLWRFDATWKAGRRQYPWLKKPPTEYILERVRFSTQPVLEIDSPEGLASILELAHGPEVLLYSSDYPHHDAERPNSVFKHQSDEFRQRVMHDNAIAFFGERLWTGRRPQARELVVA